MTPQAPVRSDAQRTAALRKANRIRTYRARRKLDLKAGRITFADVLTDPDFATARVIDVLLCLPKVGRVKANRTLVQTRCSPSKHIGGLTDRQKAELHDYLLR